MSCKSLNIPYLCNVIVGNFPVSKDKGGFILNIKECPDLGKYNSG